MKLTPPQIEAGRSLAGMSREQLAEVIGISYLTINQILNGKVQGRDKNMQKIRAAIEARGIEFIENEGVRRKAAGIEIFEGAERFHDFTDYVYSYLMQHGGDVCINAVDETQFRKYRRDVNKYREQMQELVDSGRVSVRILAAKSDFIPLFSQMRRQTATTAAPTAFYAFGDNLALISFSHTNPPYIVLHKSSPFAELYRQAFNIAWEAGEIV